MKIAACFLYILCNMLYLVFGDDSPAWGGFHLNTHVLFISFTTWQLWDKFKGNERLFLQYVTFLSLADALYTTVCVFKDKYWVLYNTNIFAYILGIGFLVFLLHCALKNT